MKEIGWKYNRDEGRAKVCGAKDVVVVGDG